MLETFGNIGGYGIYNIMLNYCSIIKYLAFASINCSVQPCPCTATTLCQLTTAPGQLTTSVQKQSSNSAYWFLIVELPHHSGLLSINCPALNLKTLVWLQSPQAKLEGYIATQNYLHYILFLFFPPPHTECLIHFTIGHSNT